MNKDAPDPANSGGDEISPAAQDALAGLISEIDSLRDELERNNARIRDLEQLADRDPLVPVGNRRAFLQELERFNALARRYDTPSSVIYLDVDGMKDINDRFGHAAGDQVLVAIAEALLDNVRASDVVGRLGGDEFGIILAHMDENMAEQKAASLADMVAGLGVERDGTAVPVSISCGVFTFTGEADVASALEAADKAMYEQKRKTK